MQEVETDWEGFGIRLGRALDRWPGGGQRKFADALAKYAKRQKITIPTSYRTLLNYLSGSTRPSTAWIEAAASVLGQPGPQWLMSGVESELGRADDWTGLGVQITHTPESTPRAVALAHLVLDRHLSLPWAARWIMHGFTSFYFAHDTEGWDDQRSRRADVDEVVQAYFGPLLRPAASRMRDTEIMALTASLAASAYLQLDAEVQNTRGFDPKKALAELKRRQAPFDLAELESFMRTKEEDNG
jgi:hypothetical protein